MNVIEVMMHYFYNLIANIAKLFEKLIVKHISHLINNMNQIIPNIQFGFRTKH